MYMTCTPVSAIIHVYQLLNTINLILVWPNQIGFALPRPNLEHSR